MADAELRTALMKITGQNLVYAVGDGIARANGRYDATTGAATVSRIQDGKLTEVTVFGHDMYLIGFAPTDVVLHVMVDRLPVGHELLPLAVPTLVSHLLTGVVKVDVDTNTYTGRLDLTKIDCGQSGVVRRLVNYLIHQAGDRARDIGFTATVDGFSRLAGFRATFPKADSGHDLDYHFAIRDVGPSVTVTRPTGTPTEASPTFYK